MGTLIEDAQSSADWVANVLAVSGYQADFSIESLKEVDRFFDEHTEDGQAVPGGLLSEDLGSRVFALGSYVGEVLRRQYGGHWRADDDDPQGEITIQMVLDNGTACWPVQRVMKRYQNGPEDGIYVYGVVAGEDA